MSSKIYVERSMSGELRWISEAEAKSAGSLDTRKCTCHPDDNPPYPCAKKYALTDCKIEEMASALERAEHELIGRGCALDEPPVSLLREARRGVRVIGRRTD